MARNTNNDKPFIPTAEQWGVFFDKWHEKMAKSLWKSGNEHDCRDAVQEAFLKVSGLSDHLHLKDPLTPKVEGCWYAFVRYHAKGILSNYHQHQSHFEPIQEWKAMEGSFEEDDWGDVDDSAALKSPAGVGKIDGGWLRVEVRNTVEAICREAGVSDRNIQAFVMNVLEEQSGDEVVYNLPEILNANNLYAIKHRIMNLLQASAERFRIAYEELLAA